ncbi:hypothetical protein FBUS_06342 [Fasciolopsis buskii]|uniref:Ankyrin repeat protein n=1 Tax=Fasciolopsis buskii TaxID=27845 RepID=A0A8E0RW24_9TREM|nr:hypothetical protein FBUS_06342 [Fasciolopsis buski]
MSRPDSSNSRKSKPVLSQCWTAEEYRSMSTKLVSSGDISRLDALVDLWASTESYSRGMSSGSVQTTRQTAAGLLASVRDRKGRTLLHLAARFVHPEMITCVTR